MKNKRIVKILILIIAIMALSISNSYAAVEIKDTTSVLTNKTISEFYDMSEEMKNVGHGLEGTNVDVKMANNYEWAAVSYFSNSAYGTGGAGQNTGVQLTGTSHYSTNGNITGVMDFGKNYTYTAGIISNYSDGGLTEDGGQSIVNNASNTDNRIDKFIYSDGGPIAKTGWYSSWTYAGNTVTAPYSFRSGLFGFNGGTHNSFISTTEGGWLRPTGKANSDVTFRPVFYAQ